MDGSMSIGRGSGAITLVVQREVEEEKALGSAERLRFLAMDTSRFQPKSMRTSFANNSGSRTGTGRKKINSWIKPKSQPFRALVKKLVDTKATVVRPAKMLRDLKKLREIGVFTRDIYARNYKKGLLVDFSIAWTEPFWLMSLIKGGQLVFRKNSELFRFDEMIRAEGIKTTVRATRDWQYCRRLRSNALCDDDDEDEQVRGLVPAWEGHSNLGCLLVCVWLRLLVLGTDQAAL